LDYLLFVWAARLPRQTINNCALFYNRLDGMIGQKGMQHGIC
jgi:hypothetical protein